jgi:hypothetical protein
MSKEMIGVDVTERVIFSDIVADTKPFELHGGLYRIGAVISGPNIVQLQTLALDGKSWIDCLDNPIATSGLSGEISIVPGQYRLHLLTDDPVSATMTCTAR